MGGFSTTNVAWSTPFESEPERNNGFQSKNVQEAIEEARGLALSSDRYLILSDYNGNANNGRLLEFFNGLDSLEAPLYFDTGTKVLQIVSTTTATDSDAMISFFDPANDPTLSTPLYTLDMNNQKRVIDNATLAVPLFTIPISGALTVRVTQNSILKPHIQLILSSSL